MYDFFTNVTSDPWQVTAFAIIVSLFVIALTGINAKPGLRSQFASIAPNTLTSIGIFFTFLGILFALQDLNVSNNDQYNESVRELLNGLKLAFFSSVVGLFTSVLFRIIEASFKGSSSRDTPAVVDISHLYEQLKNLNTNTLSVRNAIVGSEDTSDLHGTLEILNKNTLLVREALVGEGDASLSTQFSKLRNDFRDYADNVRKDGTQELVKALQEVIKDFNLKISEQFGDNFKQLNEAVAALLEWQIAHKEHVEILTKAFVEVQTGIEKVEITVAKIPDNMNSIETVFKATDTRIEQLYQGIGSLSEIRESAQNVVPELKKSIDAISISMQESMNKQVDVLGKQIEQVNEIQTANTQAIEGLTTHFTDVIKTSANEIKDSAKEAVPEVKKAIDAISTSMQESMNKQVDVLGKQIQQVNEIQTANTQAIEGLTTHFTNVIKTSANEIKDSAKEAVPEVKKAIDAISTSMQESMNKQVDVLGKQIQQVNEIQTANTQAIEGLTTHFTNVIKTSANEIKDSAKEAVPEVKKAIDAISTSMQESMNKQVDVLGKQIQQVNEIQIANSQAIEELTTHFTDVIKTSANEIKDSARQAVPEVQKAIEAITTSMQNSATKHVESIDKQIQTFQIAQSESSKEIRELTSNLSEIVKTSLDNTKDTLSMQLSKYSEVLESLQSYANQIKESSEAASSKAAQIIEEFNKQQEKVSKETQLAIARSIEDNRSAIFQNLENADTGMQKLVGRTIEKMGNNLVAITEQFVKTYEENARQLLELNKRIIQYFNERDR